MSISHQCHLAIRGFELCVHLGFSKQEKVEAQLILINIELAFKTAPAACTSDQLAETICYADLTSRLRNYVKSKQYNLIEFLAFDIFNFIDQQKYAQELGIKVDVIKHPKIAGLTGDVKFSYQNEFFS